MANCNSLVGVTKSCDNNFGGLYTIYINDQDNVTGETIVTSAHTVTPTIVSGQKFIGYSIQRNIANLVVEPTISLENGSTIYKATLTIVFHRREASKSRALQVLAEGQRYLAIIVGDANGTYSYINFAQLSGGGEETGTKKEDGSKYTVTFTADLDTRPYFVNSAVVTGLI